ncbi:ACT domain-containing protein, partial [Cutibacterium granulosum]|uniref:ACT domain-containing protein n=1 Tax=Cutibacterium granulosum TaxID=33011 RepID=UPI00396A0AC7
MPGSPSSTVPQPPLAPTGMPCAPPNPGCIPRVEIIADPRRFCCEERYSRHMTQLLLTAVGVDRPGFVAAMSTTVAEHGGNWLGSR